MRLTNYLVEKITKNEIKEALKNPNILIGAEWEFVVPKFEKDYAKDIQELTLNQQYDQYDDLFDKFEDGIVKNPPKVPKYAKDLGYTEGEEIPKPVISFEFEDMFNMILDKGYIPVKKLPFKNYIISSNNITTSKTKWIIKPDITLGPSGLEIVSPPLPVKEFLDVSKKMFDFISKYGETNNKCGFHISISLKNISNLGKELDVIKLSLFTDETYVYKYFDMRKYNEYARSVQQAVKSGKMDKYVLNQIVYTKKLTAKYAKSHFMAINIEHLDTPNEYIEFRYLGGKDYHKKFDRIQTTVGQYIYNLSLACDPDFKNKEYGLKAQRIINKAELFTKALDLCRMGVVMKAIDTDPNRKNKDLTILRKEYKNKKKELDSLDKTVYGITKEDLNTFAKKSKATSKEVKKIKTLITVK